MGIVVTLRTFLGRAVRGRAIPVRAYWPCGGESLPPSGWRWAKRRLNRGRPPPRAQKHARPVLPLTSTAQSRPIADGYSQSKFRPFAETCGPCREFLGRVQHIDQPHGFSDQALQFQDEGAGGIGLEIDSVSFLAAGENARLDQGRKGTLQSREAHAKMLRQVAEIPSAVGLHDRGGQQALHGLGDQRVQGA